MIATLVAVLCCYTGYARATVWPQPSSLSSGQDVVWLDSHVVAEMGCNGQQNLFSTSPSARGSEQHADLSLQTASQRTATNTTQECDINEYQIVLQATEDMINSISNTAFVPWKFHHRGENFEPSSSASCQTLSTISISQSSCPSTGTFDPRSYFAGDESYEILLNGSSATINSNNTLGTLRALETFKQLFYAHTSANQSYAPNTPVHIVDQPTWNHRAVSLDIARNAYDVQSIKNTLDAMATAKFSVLHLHASDCQSWPLEIPSMPDLAAKGAYQPDLVWSVDDLQSVQAYGASKGIAVVVELDMPGHTAAIHFAYPDLVAAFNESDWNTFAAEPQSGQLKLNSTAVYAFLDSLFGDLLPRLTKYTPIYHMGGDEFNSQVYLLDETVRSNSSAVLQPLVQKFMSHVLGYVQKYNMRPMVWEEMILEWNLTLPLSNETSSSQANSTNHYPTGTLVQVWKSSDDIQSVVEQGHSAIFGDYNNWYLDCGFGGFINPYPSGFSPVGVPYNTSGGVPTAIHDPYLDYCNPLKNWRHIYVYDPLQNITDPNLVKLVEGGEVLLWSEQSDPVDLDFKLWPRAAAAAEVLWSGPRNASMIEEASKRLGEWRERLVLDVGVKSSPVQMSWCLMEGGCVL